MVDTIEYIDWESHKHTTITLCDTVTAILGNSHSGKSGLVRGIEWARSNRPVNTAYFPRGKKKPASSVNILKNEEYLSRIRTKSKNYYDINGSEFKALRTGVPVEVSEFLGMDEVNIQLQKNVHFMLTESPGERAKILNKIAGLSDMDKAIESVNKRNRAVKSAYDVQAELLKDKQAEYDELSWVDSANEMFKKIQAKDNELSELEDKILGIQRVINTIYDIDDLILELPDTSAIPYIEAIFAKDDELYSLELKEKGISERLKLIADSTKALNDVRLPTDKELANLSTRSADLKGKLQLISDMRQCIRKIEAIEDETILWNDTVHAIETEKNAYMEGFDVCPFCDKEM